MNIIEILNTKPNNAHYLKKYITFIERAKLQTCDDPEEIYEIHHICPQAEDMFPEYKNLKLHPWNSIILSYKAHTAAHMLLWRAFGGSQRYAAWHLRNRKSRIDVIGTNLYKKLGEEIGKENAIRMRSLAERGIHNTQIESREGRHYWQTEEYSKSQSEKQLTKVATGTHFFQSEENREYCRNRMTNLAKAERHPAQLSAKSGNHPWQTEQHKQNVIERNKSQKMREVTRERTLKMVREGKHPAQQPGARERMSKQATNNWQNMATIECPHCKTTNKLAVSTRWHFDKCKFK